MFFRIKSSQNKFIKLAKSLKTKKARKENDLFLIEGSTIVEEALKKGFEILHIFSHKEELLLKFERLLSKSKSELFEVTLTIMEQISCTKTPTDLIAISKQKSEEKIESISLSNKKFILYCEDIQDPGNLGTIIRTAFAAGVDLICLSTNCADIYNPKTIRGSMGGIFYGPIISLKIEDLLKQLVKDDSFEIIGSSPHANQDFNQIKIKTNKKILLMMGNEGKGLKQSSLNLCTLKVKIPMRNGIESVGVVAAGSVLMFHKWN